jgi:hypothetical protein
MFYAGYKKPFKPILWVLRVRGAQALWFCDLPHPKKDGDIAFVLDLPKANMGTSEENSATRNSIFLNNLEQWIDEIISQDGLADRELIRTIKERFERSIRANISHHEFMTNNAKENHDGGRADRHRLMADVYRALLNV